MQNKQALYLLLGANAVSGVAQGISMLAVPWYFADIIGESSTFAKIYAIATFLTLFWGFYAGTLIDRYSRKNIFLALTAVGAVVLFSIAGVGFQMGHVPTSLVALVFCFTLFNFNIHYPALYAFGQEITEKKFYGKTNSMIEIQGQSTNVIAGGLAAMLLNGVDQSFLDKWGMGFLSFEIEPWELHHIFLLDACTYVLAFSLILFIRYVPTEKKVVDTGRVLKRLKRGFHFLKKHPLLFVFGNASMSLFVILLIEIHLLLPMYVNQHLQVKADVYAASEMIYALGAILSGVGIRWMFRHSNYILGTIVLMLCGGLMFFWCSVTQQVWILIAASFLLGIANSGTRIMRITYLFNHIPNDVIGRTGSVFQMVNILLRSLFIVLFSMTFFSEGSNITWAYFIGAVFVILSITPLFIFYKRLVNYKVEEE